MATPPNDLSETFSSILLHASDYASILENLSSIFTSTMDEIDRRFFMSIDFLDYYKTYPRYPLDFKVIHNLGKYNILSIYNIVQNDVKYLLDAIESQEILSQKSRMDKIPESDVKRDYGLQLTYFSKISTDILEHGVYNGFIMDKNRRSYIFKTFGHFVSQANIESSLICEYALYLMLFRNMRSSLRIYESALQENIQVLRKNQQYADSFAAYIEKNKTTIAEHIIKYILEYTYKISNPSGTFLNEITKTVERKLSGLSDIFLSSVSIKDSIAADLIMNASECLYNYISAKFVNSAADPELKVISEELSQILKTWELEENYNPVLENYSTQSFREYLYLVYYYKNYPRKFLNVLQLMVINYVKNHMVDENASTFNPAYLLSRLKQVFLNGIDANLLQTLLEQNVTPDYMKTVFDEQKIIEYSNRTGMIGCIETIFSLDNPDFESYIDDLYETLFSYLKNTVQVEPYYEYHFNKKMLYWYLLAYLKRDILENKVFSKEEEMLREIIHTVLDSPKYTTKFNASKMKSRAEQYAAGNISNITNLFNNIVETAADKKLHSENISYFFS